MNEDKTLLNFPVTCHLKGRPTTAVLQRAMLEMKRRNKSLRRSYFEGDNFAEQKPVEDFGVHLDYQDFSSAEPPRIRQGKYISDSCRQELGIEEREVFRAALAQVG